MYHIRVGIFIDGDSSRCMRAVNHSDTAHNAAFDNGFLNLRCDVVKIFPLGGKRVFKKSIVGFHGFVNE